MLVHQTDTIIWIPITEKPPPSGLVLASTKIDVHILQYSKGPAQMAHGELDGPIGKEVGHPILQAVLIPQRLCRA